MKAKSQKSRLPERRSRDSASSSQSGDAGDCQQWWSAKVRRDCRFYVDTCDSLDVSRNLNTDLITKSVLIGINNILWGLRQKKRSKAGGGK